MYPYDDSVYHQPPFEKITEEKYNEMVEILKSKNLDFTKIMEENDKTSLRDNLACSGSSCEIL